jgi:pimeloyl-ACP methyl ester carboxylesterase
MLIMADPTVVLVHGAFADASSWSRLYAELAGDGLMIKAPPNPLRGVAVEDGEYTKGVIEQIDGPVLLVGHSYGGAVITATGVTDNVVGLVYVAAFAPDEGEDLGTLQSNFPAPRFSYDRMGATVTVVEGASHVMMLSRPAVVADVIREAVRGCAP